MNIFETTGCMTKINSQFPFTEKLKEFSMNPKWQDRYSMWDFVSASSEDIGQILYEHGKNFVQNVRDIDTCSIHALHSMAEEMDLDYVFNYDLVYPVPLEKLMNLLSTNRSYLLTTGYLLEDYCLDYIYDKYGINMNNGTLLDIYTPASNPEVTGLVFESGTAPVTGLSYKRSIEGVDDYARYTIYVPDEDYIEYMESLLRQHLIEYTYYEPISETSPYYDDDCNIIYPDPDKESLYPTEEVRENAFRISQEYIGFLDSITHNPELEWNSETSAGIVEEGVHILRNICIKTSYYRDILKDTIQRYAMIGSTRAIEKLMYEYILRNMTEQTAWRYWVAPTGTSESIDEANELNSVLPPITAVDTNFNVQVIEYWDYTEYMNISAASPYVCGIVGYDTITETVSSIDISGNIVTGTNTYEVPIWDDTGLCGLVVSGGNERYWEQPEKQKYIDASEHTPAEVSAFYREVGVEGNSLQDYCDFQAYLFDTFAVSGLDRLSIYPELCGVSLVDIHKKYIGNISGDVPPANIKNQEYPTMAPQPFIWNLVEKINKAFLNIDARLLSTSQAGEDFYEGMVDIFGNIIDSWKFPNQEFISYSTFYEESHNNNWDAIEDEDIDRDGPWHPDALSAYLIDPSPENMAPYYEQIAPGFDISKTVPNIALQLETFYDDIQQLENYTITQYSYDHVDNHYMLYKEFDNYDTRGKIWMRYRNHPLCFPLTTDGSQGDCKQFRYTPQIFTYGGLLDIDDISSNCYDFGITNSILWMIGNVPSKSYDRLIITEVGMEYYPPPVDSDQWSILIGEGHKPQVIDRPFREFVGKYDYYENMVFVYYNGYNNIDKTISFDFYYYNIYDKTLDTEPKHITINSIYQPYKYNNQSFEENIFRLSADDNNVSIAYEANKSEPLNTGYDNSIVTIDILKNTLSDNPDDYLVHEWKYIQDPYNL